MRAYGYMYYIIPSYNGYMNDKNVIDLDENQIYKNLKADEWIALDIR